MREELLKPDSDPTERAEETTLRPRRLDEFVGQDRLLAAGSALTVRRLLAHASVRCQFSSDAADLSRVVRENDHRKT